MKSLFTTLLLELFFFVFGATAVASGLQLFKERHIIEGVESLFYLIVAGIGAWICVLVAPAVYSTLREMYVQFKK